MHVCCFPQEYYKTSKIPNEVQSFMSNMKICKVAVSQVQNTWEITFLCSKIPTIYLLNECKKSLKYIFPGVGDFILQPKLETNTDAKEFIRANWKDILAILGDNFPSTRGWLKDSNYDFIEDNSIEIKFNSLLAIKYLQKNGCKLYLENFLAKLIEEQFIINFKYDPSIKNDPVKTQCIHELVAQSVDLNAIESRSTATVNKDATKTSSKTVLMGKNISQAERAIVEVTEEEHNIVIAGRPFAIEVKELKTGRSILSFNITDLSDSLTCKVIREAKVISELQEHLLSAKKVKVKGTVQIDRYSQELVIMARDIITLTLEERKDLAPEKRVELHLHTKFSSLDAIASPKELIKQAAQWGHEAIAITDHGVVQAFPEAHKAGKDNNIKIIYGTEAYIFDDISPKDNYNQKKKNYHCILLVKTMEGLKNLYELITESHLNYFKRVPRIPKSLLSEKRTGLIVGSACEAGELIQSYLYDKDSEKLEEIAQFYDFLEIQPRGNNYFLLRKDILQKEEQLLELNTEIYKLGKKLAKPVVATGDVHFLNPEDEAFRKIIMAGKGFSDADDQPPLYFKTTDEMLEEFSYLGENEAKEVVIDYPRQISDQIEEITPIPDKFHPPEIEGSEDEINEMLYKKAHEWYGEELPQIVQERITKEATAIIDNGFAVLYLIAHKLVKKSNEDGYLVGSRGSVGSSFVATLCEITEVNPLEPHYRCPECKYSEFITDGSFDSGADLPDKKCPKCESSLIKDGHNIPFEVFMGFKGDKIPDIDLNFSGEYQARAQKYTEKLFGKDNVFRAGTISTIASRTAFGYVKNYLDDKNVVSRSAEINRLVEGCTGIKRTTGQHPGGLMVIPKNVDVHMFTPLQRPADDVKSDIITTHFDYHSISDSLVKLDNLGHDDPTIIKILEDLTGVDAQEISLSDPKTLSLFRSTEALGISAKDLGSPVGTFGVPEFGTRFVRQMLVDTKPTTFSELVRISGFSHGTDVWLNNAQDLIKSSTAQLSEAISARDDIMIYLIQRGVEAGRAFKIMEAVRKGRGVTPEDEQMLIENNIPKWYIESCKKIKYMFPKAHAVAYVMMAFRIAYFKVYYPLAFYTAFLTVRADEFDAQLICKGIEAIRQEMKNITDKGYSLTQKESKSLIVLEIALEMNLRGFEFQKVSLKKSHYKNFLIEGNTIIPPFAGIEGVGVQAALNIAKSLEEKYFTSIEDLRIRAKLSKTVIDSLREHGCLDELPETDQLSLFS